jgi:RNA polymerase sigma factor for flagellar operon FliA
MAQPAVLRSVADPPRTVTELVEDNLALVGHLVREVLAKVPAHVGRDVLTSAGMMALVVSAQSYEPDRGVPFARFAAIRIRGALLDELRGMDWAARSVRSRAREVAAVQASLAAALGHNPRSEDVAAALGMTIAELDALQTDVARATVLSLQGFAPESGADLLAEPSPGPEALIMQREQLGYLHDSIAELPERLRFVVTSYFFEQRQMSDIAVELGVTESRVSQMRAEALRLIRDGMNAQLDPWAVSQPKKKSGRVVAHRAAYISAIARRSTLADRLAMSTPRGDMLPRVGVPCARIA